MTLLPDTPPDDSRDGGAERTVWEAIRAELPSDAALLHGLRLQEGSQDREADLVVVLPWHGIAVVEVKGGRVWLAGGQWRQGRGAGRPIDPAFQANRAKHALREYLGTHVTALRNLRFTHLVAFPGTVVPPDWRAPDLPREMILDAEDLADGRGLTRIQTALRRHHIGHEALTQEQVESVLTVLTPVFLPQSEAVVLAAEHAHRLEWMTRDQERVLDLAAALPRIHVVGGAGSGKTWLALARARRLARSGQRVALLCYSRGLAWYLQRVTAQWPARERPAWVGLFHELPVMWGAEPGRDDVAADWEERLPAELGRLAAQRPEQDLFDAIVVDEAQDFGNAWWPAVVRCLRAGEQGGLSVFSDDAQRVFPRDGEAPLDLVRLELTENLRSTREIARTFAALTPDHVRTRGLTGPPVRVVAAGDAAALQHPDPGVRESAAAAVVQAADEAIEALLEEGWDPGHVALLCTGRRHPEQVSNVTREGWDSYWEEFFAGQDVFYGHVLGFKGLERRAVVLALNGVRDPARARHLLYTGMSRAQTLLVLVAPRDLLAQIGGAAMHNRLRDAQDWDPAQWLALQRWE